MLPLLSFFMSYISLSILLDQPRTQFFFLNESVVTKGTGENNFLNRSEIMKSEVMSQVLSRLLDSRRYDSRLRPNYAGENKLFLCHIITRQLLGF